MNLAIYPVVVSWHLSIERNGLKESRNPTYLLRLKLKGFTSAKRLGKIQKSIPRILKKK